MTQNSVSFSCQSKQLSRCCINFPHELTCQILTNQSIHIGRRVWPTRDHGKKSLPRSSPHVFLKNWLNFCVRGQFEIKIIIVWGHNDIDTTYLIAALHARVGGAPLLSKSTHPRKFGNHVTVHRPTDRCPSAPQENQCLLSHF